MKTFDFFFVNNLQYIPQDLEVNEVVVVDRMMMFLFSVLTHHHSVVQIINSSLLHLDFLSVPN